MDFCALMRFTLTLVATLMVAVSSAQTVYDITDFGASPANINNTAAIQSAIDACTQTGGIVTVPAGLYTIGTIILKSNVTLEVQAGGILSGSNNLDDYPVMVNQSFRSVIDQECQRSLIYAEAAVNVGIIGSGIINGNGSLPPFADQDAENRPFGIRFVSCKNVLFKDIKLMESAFWMQHLLNCEDIVVDGITIINHGNSNNDGINLDCVRNAVVRNCFVDSSDDGIAIKSTGDVFCEKVVVENCTLKTLSRGIKIGTESVGGFHNIIIRNTNCDASTLSSPALPGQSGFSINSVDGAILDSVVIDNVTIKGYKQPILLRLGNRGKRPTDSSLVKGPGVFRNLILRNIQATAYFDSPDELEPYTPRYLPSIISGIPGHQIENITLENIDITYTGGNTTQGPNPDSIPENEGSKPAFDMFGTDIPASGFFIRHAKNVKFSNVCLTALLPDVRPLVTLVDAQGVDTNYSAGSSPLTTCINSNSTGVLNSSSLDFQVYPNPANRVLNIQRMGIESLTIELIDSKGCVQKRFSSTQSLESIDLSELTKGIYVVHLYSTTQSYSRLLEVLAD